MKMPLVSIILPTYNGEKYISKAIESCLQQSYHDVELIIVNDCSTDGTLAIAQAYAGKDKRIRIISNPENHKLPGSLNIGFAQAKGAYLTWTSDDNYFAPRALEKLVAVLDSEPDTGIVYSSYRFIDERDQVLEGYGKEPEWLLFDCIVGACFMYRKEVHERLGGYAGDKFRMEDMDFWLRAAVRFKLAFIDEKDLYFYRKHTGSLTFGIYGSEPLLAQYRKNYIDSYRIFFRDGLGVELTEEELRLHIELFFEDLTHSPKGDFTLGEKLLAYIDYLDKLKDLPWQNIRFRSGVVKEIVAAKKKKIVSLLINDLEFENKTLSGRNPRLAAHINKPISWYYREYEVLPLWYKRLGHIIKILTGNRPLKPAPDNKTNT